MKAQARGRGRPPKSADDKRTAELRIRLTEEERLALDRVAGGQTSTWARQVLLEKSEEMAKVPRIKRVDAK